MENPKNITHGRPFVLFSHRSVQESFNTGFLDPSSDRDLASTGIFSETVALEVVSSLFMWIPLKANLGLGLLRSSLP